LADGYELGVLELMALGIFD